MMQGPFHFMKLPDNSWFEFLSPLWSTPPMLELQSFLKEERAKGKVIYPKEEDIFRALKLTPLENVRVVVLGQDPYHGEGQAQGLAFSVPGDLKLPPSLKNIYKELSDDLSLESPTSGDLTAWANQGVLLLNTVLSVEAGKAGSHHGRGWEIFTDHILRVINEKKNNVVFILWGSPAQKKTQLIDESRHLILMSPHPSPLSSYRGFFGSKPFSKTNAYLKSHGLPEIEW